MVCFGQKKKWKRLREEIQAIGQIDLKEELVKKEKRTDLSKDFTGQLIQMDEMT